MKNSEVAILVVLIVLLGAFSVNAAHSSSLSAVGISWFNPGLGVTFTTRTNFGEVRLKATGERTENQERRSYEEENYFSAQSIFYPDFLSWKKIGMEVRGGLGVEGLLNSKYKEEWSSKGYSEESNIKGEIYAIGAIQISLSLDLTKGFKYFALTNQATSEPSPFWKALEPIYVVGTLGGGPGWSSEKPGFKYKPQAELGIEYRF